MAKRIDLNCDMGEGMGDDAALLDIVTSANIACGWHAGNADVMAQTMRLAVKKGVGIGAHPGFADLEGFGRKRMDLSKEELMNLVSYQLGAAQGIARSVGGRVRHLKLHGALANMASEDPEIARTCFKAALALDPEIVIMVLAETAQQQVAEELGCNWAGEIFADRAYENDATLVDRRKPGAVIHDPDLAAKRVLAMIETGAILTESGKCIPTKIDTVCLHGDTPEAVAMARMVREKLENSGVSLARL